MGAHWQIQPDRESDEGGALERVGGGTTGGGCLNGQREGRPSRKGQPHSQGLQSRDLESVMEPGGRPTLSHRASAALEGTRGGFDPLENEGYGRGV